MHSFFAFLKKTAAHAAPNVDASSSSHFDAFQKPLDQFRTNTRRLSIHPAERALLWVVSAHLIFLPWALGAVRPWGQITSLVFSIVSIAVALFPRNYSEEHTGSNRFRLIMWPKLLKFPIFWLGLALLGYILVQALNPAWRYMTDGTVFWMEQIESVSWLPTGVEAPFAKWNQWRMLTIYSSVWLTVCAVWVGFTRRRTLQAFLMALAFNGLLVAAFGIAELPRLFGNGKMFWFFTSPNPAFFSSFIYKNHGGAYLNLILTITCGLAAWYYLRGLRRMEKSNPSGLFAFFATCIAAAILLSFARGATLIMFSFLFICVVAFVIHQIFLPSENRKAVVAIVLILIFGYFLKTGYDAMNMGEAWDRLQQGISRQDASLQTRELAREAASEMLGDNWGKGIGAGSFRFLFTPYQHRYPDLVSIGGAPAFWEHAHNDILQFPIELGLGGILLLAASAGYWLFSLVKSYFWENALSTTILLGLVLTVVYAWWDFPFQCPAILMTWCVLWAAITIWTRLEEQNARG